MTAARTERKTSAAAVLAILAGLICPSPASAHAVGSTQLTASSYQAVIATVPPGIEASVVGGDINLWMAVNPRLTVIVRGARGEPYLRFSPAGVDVNQRSPTAYQNRPVPVPPPPGDRTGVPPQWHHLTSGHSYEWHEDRLHALAAAARIPGSNEIGRWVVPLLVDGHLTQIRGNLWYRPAPTRLWFWPLAVLAATLPAVIRLRRRRWIDATRWLLSAVTVAALVIGRSSRELYGRPHVSHFQTADLILTCVTAIGAATLLLRRGTWSSASLVVGMLGLYEGLVLFPALTRGLVLTAAPAAVERGAAVACLGGGVGVLALWLTEPDRHRAPLVPPDRRDRRRGASRRSASAS